MSSGWSVLLLGVLSDQLGGVYGDIHTPFLSDLNTIGGARGKWRYTVKHSFLGPRHASEGACVRSARAWRQYLNCDIHSDMALLDQRANGSRIGLRAEGKPFRSVTPTVDQALEEPAVYVRDPSLNSATICHHGRSELHQMRHFRSGSSPARCGRAMRRTEALYLLLMASWSNAHDKFLWAISCASLRSGDINGC